MSEKRVEDNRIWETLTIPMKLRIDEPQRFSIGGTATFLRDKSVFFSFRMLGMEVAVISLTADSLTAVDKFHKCYLQIPTRTIFNNLDFNIADIQDLLLGRVPECDFNKFGRSVNINLVENNGMLKNISIAYEGKDPFIITYGSDRLTSYGLITESLNAEGKIGSKLLIFNIEWSPEKTKWNEESEFREIKIGKGYRKLNPENFTSMFSDSL